MQVTSHTQPAMDYYSFGDIIQSLATQLPADSEFSVHVKTDGSYSSQTWHSMNTRTNKLTNALQAAGIKPGAKIAFYLRNCSEYLELLVASFKGGYSHVNVNYRYLEKELHYIFDNSDASVVVYSEEFSDRIHALVDLLPQVKLWVQVGACDPQIGENYEALLLTGSEAVPQVQTSPEDLVFLYTGGTTGMPKGVMWPQRAMWLALINNIEGWQRRTQYSLADYTSFIINRAPNQRQLPACPLMHGTGLFSAVATMLQGGCVITLAQTKLNAEALWSAVDQHKVEAMAIVGDAFAKPMLEALKAHPNRWDISSIKNILSSGVMWSSEVKEALLEFHPDMRLLDTFGSSEGLGFGASSASKGHIPKVARFTLGPNVKVFNENHEELKPGDPDPGFVAVTNTIPIGYYKDEEKTNKTFPLINGTRYSIPGDWCRVETDGTLTLLGRGSECINSAGEKIYPEEVEETLKTHNAVEDALVCGLDHQKWGQQVVAVVRLTSKVSEAELQNHCRSLLAAYKVPKRVLTIEDMGRAVNGKANYKFIKEYAQKHLD